jgi:thiol-disulfide isomerase/thioredoxin
MVWLAFALSVAVASPSRARADGRPADQILKEIDEVKLPTLDRTRTKDKAYVREYVEQRSAARKRRAELIGELFRTDPENPRLAHLMSERWSVTPPQEAVAEAEKILAHTKTYELRRAAMFGKARALLSVRKVDPEAATRAVEEFLDFAPKNPAGPSLLMELGLRLEDGSDRQKAAYRRVIEDFPDSPRADTARGQLRRLDAVGKPFDLTFNDAITGSEVSIKALRGKVVVVDFWATWCGPCVAEMPQMKKLYAEYKDKGVEFIGVSLDAPKEDGGLDKLKEFVANNEITWPQYYQGNHWASEFSTSWGINLIPTVFLVDQEGNLASSDARGKLEKMIPELLEKARAKADPSSGD